MADFTPYLSCTRASTGYAQTAAGTLTSFAANTLRRTDKGLLIEEARTNLARHSQAFDNAAYTKSGLTVMADAVVAPDGTTTADTLTDDTANVLHRVYHAPATGTAGSMTLSIYAKAGTLNWFQLVFSSQGANVWCNFNVTTGVIGLKGTSITDQRIEALADDWFRCSCTITYASGLNGPEVHLINSDFNGTNPVYVGTGTGTLHIWGAQLEVGAYPSSYIPVTTANVTRAADAVTLIGTADTILDGAAASVVASMDTILKTTQVSIVAGSGSVPLAKAAVTTVKTGTLEKTGLASAVTNASKYGAAWTAVGGRSVTGQGLSVATDAGTTAAPATSYLGATSTGTEHIDAYIRRLSLWNTRLADADLQAETA